MNLIQIAIIVLYRFRYRYGTRFKGYERIVSLISRADYKLKRGVISLEVVSNDAVHSAKIMPAKVYTDPSLNTE